jgi:chromosome segregation ATPase
MHRVPGTTRTRHRYPEEGTMTVTLEDRVEVLEGKVEKNLEVLTEFRREVNGKLDEFGQVQERQSRTLDIHTGKFNNFNESIGKLTLDKYMRDRDIKDFKEEVSGKLERLGNDVARLDRHVIGDDGLLVAVNRDVLALRDDVNGLTIKVDKLQADVTELKTDVAGLKTELTEFKVEVRGTLAEILDRLPPKAA